MPGQQGFENIRHFTNHGYSGTNFNQPGFSAMIAEVEAGHVATVIVKDMSRFGRNYLQVGFYTEMMFPDKGVRFIAVNNHADSNNPNENDFTSFLNIMNEFYAHDTSNKIRAIFKSRMQDGKRCSGAIPYGYKREPVDKQTLVVDEPAAQVVRRIYQMVLDGYGRRQIADTLTAEKVLIPSAYEERYYPENARHHAYHDPCRWNSTTIGYILERQEYLGHTVLGKSVQENFKSRKCRKARPDEQLVFPNTHQAIIDEETWNNVQRLKKKGTRRMSNGTVTHRLSGIVFCADCGHRMSYRSPHAQHRPNGKTYDSDSSFVCSSYRQMYRNCTMHYIKASALERLVLGAVQKAKVEQVEKQKNAQLAYSFDIALQNELSMEENIALARQFLWKQFVSRGMTVDFTVHNRDREPGGVPNPHFHVLVPIRPLNPNDTWGAKQRRVYQLDQDGNPLRNEQRLDTRIDLRSYERQGVEQLPTVHEGPAVRQMERRGISTEKGKLNRWIRLTNQLLSALRRQLSHLKPWLSELRKELAQAEKPEPGLTALLTDYLNQRNQGAYSQKAKVRNLKDFSQALSFLSLHNLATVDDLEQHYAAVQKQADAFRTSSRTNHAPMNELKELLRQEANYRRLKPLYDQMKAIRFTKSREAFQQEHEGKLKLFYLARRTLKKACPDGKLQHRQWQAEYDKLQASTQEDYQAYLPLKEELAQLLQVRRCVTAALRNRGLEPKKQSYRHQQER